MYLLKLLLSFSKLSQVESSNLLSVLNLLLVGSGLVLQLLHQLVQPLKVLLLLLAGELKLLDLPVSSDGALVSLRRPEYNNLLQNKN